MYGVVALLDEENHRKIEQIWREIRKTLGTHGISKIPVPHFSFHVAKGYDLDALKILVESESKTIEPFNVRTIGLGIFTGVQPVLHIPIMNSPLLLEIHERLWNRITPLSDEPVTYYHPDLWRTHITLTHHDVGHDLLPKVIQLLSRRDFSWTIHITQLAILSNDENPEKVIHQVFDL